MNKTSISKDSDPEWKQINAMQDEDIDLSDIPEVEKHQMARATLRIGGKAVPSDVLALQGYAFLPEGDQNARTVMARSVAVVAE